MKVNILSSGRFHVLDLARELAANGLDIKFYSFVPQKRIVQFGLPKQCSTSLFYIMLPFLILTKIFKGAQWSIQLRIWVQDRLTALIMRKCDILIAMSGEFIVSTEKAKKGGATIIIERGSKHILEQKRILDSNPSPKNKRTVPDANVKRELKCYELADYISVPSLHAKHSFLIHKYPEEKIIVNPYGVDLSMFYPQKQEKIYDVIMVGAWSYQKGADLILQTIRELKLQFIHVGALVDVEFKEDNYCHHHAPVDQKELIHFYNMAKIFILPSRQDGFGMVLTQALACNLPIISSYDTGAEDLKKLVKKPEYIITFKQFNSTSIKESILKGLEAYNTLGDDNYAGDAMTNLTWEAYGKRYYNNILHIINKPS